MDKTQSHSQMHRAALAPCTLAAAFLLAACGGDEADQPGPDGAADTSSHGDFTMEEVEQNDSAESCWAVMDGAVYDLTAWIDEHPGGESRIEQLCGTDASEAFDSQHGGQDRPEDQLSELEIGTLAD